MRALPLWVALLALPLAFPAATSTHGAEPPVVASGALEGAGYIHWTIAIEGATHVRLSESLQMEGTFGAAGVRVLDGSGDLWGASTSFAYSEGPSATLALGDVWILPRDGTERASTGGGASGGCAGPRCTGILHVIAWAASTGSVEAFEASVALDNATLLATQVHPGGTYAWTTRTSPQSAPTGLFGPAPGPAEPTPESGGTTIPIAGRVLGEFFASADAQLRVETPTGTRACTAPWGCELEAMRDGAGAYAFRYEGADPHAQVFLAAVDADVA